LKPANPQQSSGTRTLSALDPGKQGLKLNTWYVSSVEGELSALDPGKQGLKHLAVLVLPGRPHFQRLIQENKD